MADFTRQFTARAYCLTSPALPADSELKDILSRQCLKLVGAPRPARAGR
jgi:hypothetical protein